MAKTGCSADQEPATSGYGPTVPPPRPDSLNRALRRNIDALRERRRAEAAVAGVQERIANQITGFAGSMRFVWLHLFVFGFWIAANLGSVPGFPPWDPTFVGLAMVASVEAIFLSTFVLISQNRMMAAADRRDDLDLQINLLAEHEVTQIVRMVRAIGHRRGVGDVADEEVEELARDVAPEAVLDAIDDAEAPDGARAQEQINATHELTGRSLGQCNNPVEIDARRSKILLSGPRGRGDRGGAVRKPS